ncbi:hypothetical protein NHX12_007321, partial [Muraenolepis orangiensis]
HAAVASSQKEIRTHKRKEREHAVGRTSLPKDPRLCSRHFTPDSLDSGVDRQREVGGASRFKRKLKIDAIPTICPLYRAVQSTSRFGHTASNR